MQGQAAIMLLVTLNWEKKRKKLREKKNKFMAKLLNCDKNIFYFHVNYIDIAQYHDVRRLLAKTTFQLLSTEIICNLNV